MFTIVRDIFKNGQHIKQFFCNDEEWHNTGNDAMQFKTKKAAKLFYLDRPIFLIDNKRTYTQGTFGGKTLMGDISYAV